MVKKLLKKAFMVFTASAVIATSTPTQSLTLVESEITEGILTTQVEAASKKAKKITVKVMKQKDYIEKDVYLGNTYQIKLKGAKKAEYKSSNTRYASVTSKGKIKLKKYGSVTITVTGNNKKSAALVLNVIDASIGSDIKKITLENKTTSLVVGDAGAAPTIRFNPEKVSNETIVWSSSKPEVCSVNEAGQIVGKAKGSSTIKATTLNGKTASYSVKVKAADVKKSDQELDEEDADSLIQDAQDNNDTGTLTDIISSDGTHTHVKGSWEVTTDATCQTTGTKIRKCSVCGEQIDSQVIAKKSHRGTWTILQSPTCKDAGVKVKNCNTCGTEIERQAISITSSHTWTTPKDVSASCTGDVSYTETCAICGATRPKTLKKIAHHYEYVVTKNATCKEAGSQQQVCTICGATGTTKSIAKLSKDTDHDWAITSEIPITCTTSGSVTYTCQICGKTKTNSNATAGHKWTNFTITTQPTCGQKGAATVKCSVCGLITQIESASAKDSAMKSQITLWKNQIAATGNHTYVDFTEQPTCTKPGKTLKKCSVCKTPLTGSERTIEATGHRWGNVEYKAPTCTQNGTYTRHCTVCNKEDSTFKNEHAAEVAKTGHKYITINTSANCTTPAYSMQKCTACGNETSKKKIAEANGHNKKWYIKSITQGKAKNISVTLEQYCTVCGVTTATATNKVAMPNKHNGSQHYYTFNADTGKIVIKCISCKTKFTGTVSGTTLTFGKSESANTKTNGWTNVGTLYGKSVAAGKPLTKS